jgi:hypothetical protein
VYRKKKIEIMEAFLLGSHVPVGLEGCSDITFCANYIAWQTTDTVGTSTNGVVLDVGDAAAVTADTSSVTCRAFVAETWRGSKVQACEG